MIGGAVPGDSGAFAGRVAPPSHGLGHRCPAGLRSTPAGLLLLIVLLAGFGVRYALVHPAQNCLLDFRAFYSAGLAVQSGLNPYDQTQRRAVIDPLLPGEQSLVGYGYPPPTLVLMYAISSLPYEVAQVAWCLLQFGLLVSGLLLLFRALHIEFGSPAALLIACVFWISDPVFNLFRWGQSDGIRVALLGLAIYALARRRPAAAGFSIALAAIAKVYPVAYLWAFVLRREWRGLLAGAVTIAALMAIGLAASSPAARRSYLGNNRNEFAQVAGVISPQNMSLTGYLHRAFVHNPDGRDVSTPWLDLGAAFARNATVATAGLLIVLTSGWIIRGRGVLSTTDCVAALVPVVLLAEVNAWPHHCVVLIVPLSLVVWCAASQPRLAPLDAVWVGAALFLFAFCPVHRAEVELPDRLEHLVGPTTTYAMLLTWLFMLVRYPVLKQRAEHAAVEDAA